MGQAPNLRLVMRTAFAESDGWHGLLPFIPQADYSKVLSLGVAGCSWQTGENVQTFYKWRKARRGERTAKEEPENGKDPIKSV